MPLCRAVVPAESYANVQTRNLRAFGIAAPSFPAVVRPFSNYDSAYRLIRTSWTRSHRNYKASQNGVEASKTEVSRRTRRIE